MVRTHHFRCSSPGSIPGQGTKILQAVRRGQKINTINKNAGRKIGPKQVRNSMKTAELEREFYTNTGQGKALENPTRPCFY